MGQYHTIINVTKGEKFNLGGAKLYEQASDATAACLLLLLSNSNGRGGGDFMVNREYDSKKKKYKPLSSENKKIDEALKMLSGHWIGDSIVVQGDYAKPEDKNFVKDFSDFKNITADLKAALPEFFEEESN